MEKDKNRRILIVDDNAAIHEDFRKTLRGLSGVAGGQDALEALEAELFGDPVAGPPRIEYEICSAFQGEQALEMVQALAERREHYALAFVDMRMPPGWDGVQTIAKIWEIDPEIQIVICTAYSEYSWEQILARFGASDRLLILKKPFDTAEVCQLACALTEKWHLARHAHLKLSQLKCMVEEQTRELTSSNVRLQLEIQESSALQASLRASETRYALAAAGANDGLWDWDLRDGSVYYSPRWKSLLGIDAAQSCIAPEVWLDRVHADDLAAVQVALSEHLAGTSEHFECEYRIRHADGQYRWMLCRGLAIRDPDGTATRLAGSQSDITDRRLAEEQLRHDAYHDVLTGLANRALMRDRLTQCLLRARRNPDHCFAVLFLDLDRFKVTNDTMGHLVGDQLLVGIASRLVDCVRATDSIALSARNQVARLGGDEFVVLLEGLRNDGDAIRVAERILEAMAAPFVIEGNQIFSSISLGIVFGRPEYERPEDLLRDADTALYQAKASGRNCYVVFDAEMHAGVMSRWWIENELRGAIARNELRLVYQPVVSITTGRLCELEALLRWSHHERGDISPAEFIPIAEEVGLIGAIGSWVFQHALQRLREWDDVLAPHPDLSIAINVSGKQVSHPGFVDEISRLLRQAEVPPSRIRLELTESALIAKGVSLTTLSKMRELDLKVHLDDFGTGYSSLSYLHRIPVDALKIDRSFVADLTTDATSASIVESIVLLAHALGAKAIAEGVETKEQLAKLRALHCDMAQGYHVGRPMEADEAVALLQSASLGASMSLVP